MTFSSLKVTKSLILKFPDIPMLSMAVKSMKRYYGTAISCYHFTMVFAGSTTTVLQEGIFLHLNVMIQQHIKEPQY